MAAGLLSRVAVVAVLAAVAGAAQAGEGKGRSKDKRGGPATEAAEPQRGFGDRERDRIQAWFAAHPDARLELPPGLAKQQKLPPGWRKKLAAGRRVPDEVWAFRVPLPHEIRVQLPPPPPGVVVVRIHDRIVRAVEKTREVIDVLGLPHP